MPKTVNNATQDAWPNFIGRICPVCARAKPKNNAFCRACYFALPRVMRFSLWKRFGEGFEQAYLAAKQHLQSVAHA